MAGKDINEDTLQWTTAQAAQRLNMPQRTVQELCRAGELPCYEMGGRYYLPTWGLREYIARKSGCPLPAENLSGVESRDGEAIRELRKLAAQLMAKVEELG